jgi:hypothetical protein
MSSVAAQVLHPIFRRPGLPACEAIGRPQKYPWGFNHWCFLTEKKTRSLKTPKTGLLPNKNEFKDNGFNLSEMDV